MNDPLAVIRDLAARDPATWGPALLEHERQLRDAAAGGPALPSAWKQAANLAATAGAVVSHLVTTGELVADQAKQDARWATCRSCANYRAADDRCGGMSGCGCYLSAKIPLIASSCPEGRWPC